MNTYRKKKQITASISERGEIPFDKIKDALKYGDYAVVETVNNKKFMYIIKVEGFGKITDEKCEMICKGCYSIKGNKVEEYFTGRIDFLIERNKDHVYFLSENDRQIINKN